MKTNYTQQSPWYQTPQTVWYLGHWVEPNIPASMNDQLYTIEPKYHQRPDKMAKDFYGNERYMFLFMMRNPNVIKDPIYDFTAGKQIYLVPRDVATKSKQG